MEVKADLHSIPMSNINNVGQSCSTWRLFDDSNRDFDSPAYVSQLGPYWRGLFHYDEPNQDEKAARESALNQKMIRGSLGTTNKLGTSEETLDQQELSSGQRKELEGSWQTVIFEYLEDDQGIEETMRRLVIKELEARISAAVVKEDMKTATALASKAEALDPNQAITLQYQNTLKANMSRHLEDLLKVRLAVSKVEPDVVGQECRHKLETLFDRVHHLRMEHMHEEFVEGMRRSLQPTGVSG